MRSEAARNQPGILKIADTDRDIDAFLDDVHQLVTQSKIYRQLWMPRPKARQCGREEMNTDRQRCRDLQGSGGLTAGGDRRLLDVLGIPQQPEGTFVQISPLWRQRQRTGRSGEER